MTGECARSCDAAPRAKRRSDGVACTAALTVNRS